MGKYGKKFRKIQLEEWKEKYFNYKKFKQLIKKYVNNKNPSKEDEKLDIIETNAVDEFDKLNERITEFTDQLDKEIKRVYVFFTNKEKKLYKDINKYLHQKEDYPEFDLSEYMVHFNLLYELSKYNLNLSIFVFYNLKAILKILKKFDKKVIGKDKDSHIKFNYIQTKLEEQNSDILYLFKFKMIDEVNMIMESLVRYFRECLKDNKQKFKEEKEENNIINDDEENKENLINKNLTYKEVYDNVEQQYKKIQKNMKNIDLIAVSTVKMFDPWKQFLRISSDLSSRLMQMNKEFSFSDVSFGDERKYSRSISITEGISFSKENKNNIYITLGHGFFHSFSFSIIIPTYASYIDSISERKYYYGILMMMAPLGSLIGYCYETKFFKFSTKFPYIISMIELIIGNILYIMAKKVGIILLFIGRFLVGLSNLRTHNKMYILNYLSRKDTSYYLTMFHGASIIGLFLGLFVNIFYNKSNSNSNSSYMNTIINDKNLGAFITTFFSIVFLLIIIFMYSEAKSKKFNKLSVSTVNRNTDNSNQKQASSINTSEDSQGQVDVQKDSVMVENIDEQLENFNKKNKYDDTNLVTRSIDEIANQEKDNLQSLKKAFYVYMIIIFTTKFINESILIYFGINLLKIDENFVNDYPYIHALVLASSYILVVIIELALAKKIECTRDKIFLLIILSLNLMNISTLIYLAQLNSITLIVNSSLGIILSNMIQKTSSHYFINIIPNHYLLCCIQGNVFINIISTIGRISSGAFLLLYKINEEKKIFKEYFDIFYYSVMTLFSFISLLLYFVFYSDIRVKAISRIIKRTNKNEVKIATDV